MSSGDWRHMAPWTEPEPSGLSMKAASSGLETPGFSAVIPDITFLHTSQPCSLSCEQTKSYSPDVRHLNRN